MVISLVAQGYITVPEPPPLFHSATVTVSDTLPPEGMARVTLITPVRDKKVE